MRKWVIVTDPTIARVPVAAPPRCPLVPGRPQGILQLLGQNRLDNLPNPASGARLNAVKIRCGAEQLLR